MLGNMKKGIHKSKGGVIRCSVVVEKGIIKDITFSGDFFLIPEDAIFKIMEELKGKPALREEIHKCIEKLYHKENILSPGTTPYDFTQSIMKALEE